VSEAGTTVIVVVDQVGRQYEFDADDFREVEGGYLHVMSDGKRVGRFTPGYTAVYRREYLRNSLSDLATALATAVVPPPVPWNLPVGPGNRDQGGDAQ
jgi:hypothetical protein